MIAVGEMDGRASQEQVRVGLLGVGLMGSAMAHRLLDRGIAVVAWDRDAEHVRDLDGRGGEPAETPSVAVRSAGVVITMLPTAEVILDLVDIEGERLSTSNTSRSASTPATLVPDISRLGSSDHNAVLTEPMEQR